MIIVSLTTIPERLNKDLPRNCIESILRQTIKPDQIVINVPRISKKGEFYSEKLAKKLSDLDPIVKVQFGVEDLGPITKIVPTLDFIKKKGFEDVLIILVDDDCTYYPSMIENLTTVKKSKPNELVIGTAGRIKERNKLEYIGTINHNNVSPYIYVDIIETFAGVLYDYSLFKNTDFVEWISTLPDFVMLADDVILSFWTKKQGAKLYKIIQNKTNIVNHNPRNTTELNKINDIGGNNEKVYDYLVDKERIDKLIKESSNNSFANFAKVTKIDV